MFAPGSPSSGRCTVYLQDIFSDMFTKPRESLSIYPARRFRILRGKDVDGSDRFDPLCHMDFRSIVSPELGSILVRVSFGT